MPCACGEPARERRGLDPVARSSARGAVSRGLRRRGRRFDRRLCAGRAFGVSSAFGVGAAAFGGRAARACRPSARRGGAEASLAFAGQDRDRRADLHPVGALGHQDLGDRALVDRLELHRRLVGLDLGEDVARLRPSSPSLTSHLASVPSSIVGDRAGILSSIGMGLCPLERLARLKANAAGGVKSAPKPSAPLALERGLTQHFVDMGDRRGQTHLSGRGRRQRRRRASRCALPPAAPPRPTARSRCWRSSSRRTSSSAAESRRRSRKNSGCGSRASSAAAVGEIIDEPGSKPKSSSSRASR